MDTSVLTIIVTFGIFLFAQLSFFVAMVKVIVKPIEKNLDNHIKDTDKKIDALSLDLNQFKKEVNAFQIEFTAFQRDVIASQKEVNAKLDRLLSK